MLDPASAAKLFAELRDADPLTALRELSAWLEEAKDISADDEKARSDILALIQEAGDAHVFKLLAQSIARQSDHQAARESNWNALSHYLRGLSDALCASARRLLEQAATNPSLQLPAAAGAARGLHACHTLAKLYLVRYLSVPPKLWQLAYAVHGDAEKADCAAKPVRMHAQKAATTVTRELLRLLMLQSSSPEMMTPEQIEVADRVIEQLGGDFTLGPRGSADDTFRFDPGGDQPPQRSTDTQPQPDAAVLYFGPGMGFDALKRLHMELAQMRRAADVKPFGQDIAPHVQASAVRHLMLFWGQASPYTAPARSEATGTLKIVHGYAQIWQQLSSARSATSELSLADDSNATAAQAPETWTLQDTGGNELGAQIPLRSGDWARSGDVVGVSMGSDDKYWLGLIRSMHAEPGHGMRANISILSGEPQAAQLRLVIEQGGVDGVSEKAAAQFAFSNVRAIILSDGSAGSQKANFLLPPEHWEGGRVYEGTVAGTVRHLHSLQFLRRGDDYVRASFEWVSVAQA